MKVGEELRYAASEARFEGEAHKEHCIRSWHRRGVFGGVDGRISSRLAKYGAVSGPPSR